MTRSQYTYGKGKQAKKELDKKERQLEIRIQKKVRLILTCVIVTGDRMTDCMLNREGAKRNLLLVESKI